MYLAPAQTDVGHDRQIDRQTNRQAGRQAGRQTGRQAMFNQHAKKVFLSSTIYRFSVFLGPVFVFLV